jgi:hypothetical protein
MTFGCPQRDRQRERGLSTPNITTEHGEITAAKSAADASVQARESTRDGVRIGGTLGDRIDLTEKLGQ